MRRFMVLLVTEIDFVSETDPIVKNYEKHLAETIQTAAKKLSLRTIRDNKVKKVQVAEIKGLVSL